MIHEFAVVALVAEEYVPAAQFVGTVSAVELQ